MKRLFLSVFLAGGIPFFASASDPVVWPIPALPVGANLSATAAPRLDWLERFQLNLTHSKGKKFDFILDGDSITDFWPVRAKDLYDQRIAKYNAFDFGISGDQTQHLLWRLQQGQVDGQDPKLIMLMIGTNNLHQDTDEHIVAGIEAVVDDYEKRCPSSHLLLLGIFPRGQEPGNPLRARITAINEKISHRPEHDSRVTYLDIGSKFLTADGALTAEVMPDFLHPSAAGYQIWIDAVQPVLDKYFGPKTY